MPHQRSSWVSWLMWGGLEQTGRVLQRCAGIGSLQCSVQELACHAPGLVIWVQARFLFGGFAIDFRAPTQEIKTPAALKQPARRT